MLPFNRKGFTERNGLSVLRSYDWSRALFLGHNVQSDGFTQKRIQYGFSMFIQRIYRQ